MIKWDSDDRSYPMDNDEDVDEAYQDGKIDFFGDEDDEEDDDEEDDDEEDDDEE